jgi:CO/xanthine dehydrogenase FAD-binding subunit
MRMPDFELAEPANVRDACALLAEDPEGSAVLAGGTDVIVYLKEGTRQHRRLVSLRRIERLHRIQIADTGELLIGAMATVNQVARDPLIARRFPGIVDAARSLAADQVRNLATVCGNLCMAVPSADMAPILLAYNAQLHVVSPSDERMVPLREFFKGPRQTALRPADIVTAISVAEPPSGTGSASLRQGGRASLSLPIVGVAAVVQMKGKVVRDAAIALGAVAPTPILATAANEQLKGAKLSPKVLVKASELASKEAVPIDDLRASKEYRHELVKVLTVRALEQAIERASAR